MPSGPVVTAEVKGLDVLEQRLQKLSDRMAKNTVRTALRRAARVFQALISRYAPVLAHDKIEKHKKYNRFSGFTRDHIAIKIKMDATAGSGTALVGPTRKAWYTLFDEFGSPANNQSAKPFMRPAWDAGKEDALQEFVKTLRSRLHKLDKA